MVYFPDDMAQNNEAAAGLFVAEWNSGRSVFDIPDACAVKNIREVIAFPMNGKAQDLPMACRAR